MGGKAWVWEGTGAATVGATVGATVCGNSTYRRWGALGATVWATGRGNRWGPLIGFTILADFQEF